MFALYQYQPDWQASIVGVPYIMDGAAAPLREKYPNHTPRPEDVLREFLKQN